MSRPSEPPPDPRIDAPPVDLDGRAPWTRIEALDATIATCRSATAALEAWCRAAASASDETVRVRRLDAPERPPTPAQRERLEVGASEPVAYRRVRIVFGPHVLSEASNWYVPGRLTSAMNRRLAETDSPFGRVVADLDPSRRTFFARRCWTSTTPIVPATLFQYGALLVARDGMPIAEVDEAYTSGLLGLADAGAVLSRSSLASDT